MIEILLILSKQAAEKEVNPSQLLPKQIQNLQPAQNSNGSWKTTYKQNSRNKHTVSFQQEIPGA